MYLDVLTFSLLVCGIQ